MINKTYPAHDALICDQALVPALNSITSKQADTVAEIARATGQDWDVLVDTFGDMESLKARLTSLVGPR
ncbi:MAG: hypothetical protein EOO77_10335 [Oxalobacteraceae bacterium]|nr:MAG: hypothetical protein EOO77_10335 [Oxalobacteraceae bacterium]